MKSPLSYGLLFAIFLFCQETLAASSDWISVTGARMRLIAEPAKFDAHLWHAGFEIDLVPGWKTYWHTPGDSGIPPLFDTTSSQNIASTEIQFPVPNRFFDGYGTSLVYDEPVILPIMLRPKVNGTNAVFELKATLGLCKDICVLISTKLRLPLDQNTDMQKDVSDDLDYHQSKVPKLVTSSSPTRIDAVHVSSEKNEVYRLAVKVFHADQFPVDDLFVQGPEGYYLSIPKEMDTGPGWKRYEIVTESFSADKSKGNDLLTFTIKSAKQSFFQSWPLDLRQN